MTNTSTKRMARDDWLRAALALCIAGIERIKIAPLAADLGVTTGSFYWHFKNRRELLDALLEFWEYEMTDSAIDAARQFAGPPRDRIFLLMETVMENGLARYDLPFWHWAQSDDAVGQVFDRVLKKRFDFATWMFAEAGFSAEQAAVRGRMMVTYMMGESTLAPGGLPKRRKHLKLKHAILLASEK